MAKLCPNCTRLNIDASGIFRDCAASLLWAPHVAVPLVPRPAFLIGSVGLLILITSFLSIVLR
jgi:hypothetical protein